MLIAYLQIKMNKPPFKILLAIAPCYFNEYPPLGTPVLTAYLKARGVRAYQSDLNIKFSEYLKKEKKERFFSENYKEDKIRERVYYSPELKYQNRSGPVHAFAKFPPSSFEFTEKMLSSDNLFKFIDDKDENVFYAFFKSELLPELKRRRFDMVGFSLLAPSQVIASFTFGRLIKKELPEVKIVMGGPWVSLFKEELLKRSDLSAFFDFLVYFEGETALYSLIDSLRNNKPLSKVPNLIYRQGDKLALSRQIGGEDMNTLPPPDFEGLPLDKYTITKRDGCRSLTYETARGCYWGKCIFCNDLFSFRSGYKEKDIRLVIDDIRLLKRKYRLKQLMISNTVFSPWQIKEFSSFLIKKNIKIKWWAMARFERSFDRELLSLIKESGCARLVFGLESVNQGVLDLCEKGTRIEVAKRIIRDIRKVGLNAFYQIMIGIPGETLGDASRTLAFSLEEPEKFILNYYYQIPKMRICNDAEKHGTIFKGKSALPFKYYNSFRNVAGTIDPLTAGKIYKFHMIVSKAFERTRKSAGEMPRVGKAIFSRGLNFYLEAVRQERLKRYAKAVKALKEVLSMLPDSGDIYMNLAKDYLYLKDCRQAAFAAKKAVHFGFKDGYFILGCVYEKAKKYNDAVRELKRAERFFPGNFEINLMLMRCHEKLGRGKKRLRA